MAKDEEELAKKIAGRFAVLRSLRRETPVAGSQSQSPAGLETAATQFPAAQPSETAAPEPQSLDGQFSMEPHAPEALSPETQAPEPMDSAPGMVAPPPSFAAEQTKLRSLLPALAATAVAGAVLGFGGTLGLRYFDGGFASAGRIATLNARIDAIVGKIEGKEDAASAASRTALAALETRVAAAENAANKAAEAANSAEADAQKAFAARPAAQEPASGPAPAVADLGPLEARIGTLEQKLGTLESARADAQKAFESRPAAQEPVSGPAPAVADLGPLEARIGTLEQKLAPLVSALAALKADFRPQQDRANAAAGESSRAQAIAVVAESLLRKLDSGGQFSSELAALEKLGVPQASLAPLRAASESTISSEGQLTARFTTLVPGIIASESDKQASADEGFLGRVTRNAKGLLRIHRVGDAGAAGVEGYIGRIEDALAEHDLEAALKAWNELPAATTANSEGWGEAVKARLDALKAARSIEADAVAVLGKPKP
ncbi:MAG: COG4223 family protein [Methylocella sp.]